MSERPECEIELLDLIISRDETVLGRSQIERWNLKEVPVWLLHRWIRESNEFRIVFPGQHKGPSFLGKEASKRVEGGELLTAANSPTFSGTIESLGCFPRTLLVPLVFDRTLVGVLQGFTKRTSKEVGRLLMKIRPRVEILARGLHLLDLLEERERLAFTDSLTGLYNYRFLVEYLRTEIARCVRNKRSVAVLFLDIDWFKRVNDRHGHMVGSAVLEEFGRLLRGLVRESDMVVRYGGDEYVVVLTDSHLEGAAETGERVRLAISSHPFGAEQELSIRLTVSMGVALFPSHGRSADELIDAADKAMYRAKQGKKDSVRVATGE